MAQDHEFTVAQLVQHLNAMLDRMPDLPSGLERQQLAEAAAAALISLADPATQPVRRIDRHLLDSTKLYAIPDEELNLVPSLVQAAIGAFATGPIAALPDLIGILVRYRSLRVAITVEEAAVLRVLRQARTEGVGPLAVADIAERLHRAETDTGHDLMDVLARLRAKNTSKAILVEEVNSRWSIGNV